MIETIFNLICPPSLSGDCNNGQKVGWDLGLLSMHGLSSFLNGVLALQVVLYWNRTAKWSAAQASKKEA